ncbi:MAG: hypothetical protein ACYSWR_06210, partial [Planctomycetota bacterium]
MCRRLIFLISFVAVLGMVSLASAVTQTWLGGYDSNNWCNAANWDDDTPDSGDTALINWKSPERGPIIGIGCNADVSTIQGQVMDINTDGTVEVGGWSWGYDLEEAAIGTAIININGSPWIAIDGTWRATDNGTSILNIDGDPCITVDGDVRGADMSGYLYVNMSGGYFEIGEIGSENGGEFLIGDNGGGEINMSGGTMNIRDDLNMGGLRGSAPVTVNMTGGLIRVGGAFRLPGSASRAGNAWLRLYAGVVDCNEFVHGGTDGDAPYTKDYRVDIEQGVLIIDGNVVDIIDANVAEGQITGYDGEGTVVVECVGCNPL